MSLAIIAPVIVQFECCDVMGLYDAVCLLLEESRVDAFVDPGVGATDGFFIELDDMMCPEHSF
eukprot:15357454-Ditylum_brightwellii.AAC.1